MFNREHDFRGLLAVGDGQEGKGELAPGVVAVAVAPKFMLPVVGWVYSPEAEPSPDPATGVTAGALAWIVPYPPSATPATMPTNPSVFATFMASSFLMAIA